MKEEDYFGGMPSDLAVIAKRNLRAVDRGNARFNERARTVARPIGNPAPVSSPGSVMPPAGLSLDGPIDTSIGGSLPQVNAASRLSVPNQISVQPQPNQNISTTGAYRTNQAAYGQTLAIRTPRSIAKFQEQYGWGN